MQRTKMTQIIKLAKSEHRSIFAAPKQDDTSEMPFVSTYMTNKLDNSDEYNLTRKERFLRKRERIQQENPGSIVMGNKVNLAKSATRIE